MCVIQKNLIKRNATVGYMIKFFHNPHGFLFFVSKMYVKKRIYISIHGITKIVGEIKCSLEM